MSLSNDVTIQLGDDEFSLRPTLKAATAISNRFGGFQNAMSAVAAADLATIQFVIRQGVPLRAISSDDLNEAVWSTGAFKAMAPAMKFITRLANGGRDPAEDEATDEASEGDEGNGEV